MAKRKTLWLTALAAGLVLGAVVAWGWHALLGGGDPVQRAAIEGLAPRDDGADEDRVGDAEGTGDEDLDAVDLPTVINVLVAGSDSRVGLRNGADRGERPDTIMVVQIRADGSDAALLSIPRDLRVERCDGSVGRINAAFTIARNLDVEGGTCLVQTVTEITGISIHHYVELDMAGFVEVVDTVGGVEMCFDRSKPDLDIAAGCETLDGSTALSYVRDRSLDGTGDFGRMDRQQQFVKAVADEIARAGFVANVPRMARTLEQIKGSVITDERLDLRTMRAVAAAFRDADSDAIVSTTVPADPRTIGGVAYVIMRDDEAEEIFAAFRDGRAHEFVIAWEQQAAD